MKNLLQLLMRYSIFLMFIALEGVAFTFIFKYQNFQRSSILSSSNVVVSALYDATTVVTDYFQLKSINQQLIEDNAILNTKLLNYQEENTDSIAKNDKYILIPARVVNLTLNHPQNHITLDKGTADGIHEDMGVVSADGVVGVVCATSEHYSVVLPILNTELSISSKLNSNGYYGSLKWDGRDTRYASLLEIARHIEVQKGDTILTSGLSAVFPANIPIGIIENVNLQETKTDYDISVHLTVDFARLTNVRVIANRDREEILQLEQDFYSK